ncbi:hypothetical protein DAI22_05g190901 [Oryza sativa Japonica Group]|nr:hypothetical protein DAI22_05g190901 [Oryza sativa Japonica Group]
MPPPSPAVERSGRPPAADANGEKEVWTAAIRLSHTIKFPRPRSIESARVTIGRRRGGPHRRASPSPPHHFAEAGGVGPRAVAPGEGDGGGTPARSAPLSRRSRRPRAAVSTTPCALREAGEHGCGRGRHRASTSAAPTPAAASFSGGPAHRAPQAAGWWGKGIPYTCCMKSPFL